MILAGFWALLIVFLLAASSLLFLSAVSRRGTVELGRRYYGHQLVNAMDTSEIYRELMQRRSYRRAFNEHSLRQLTREVRELTQRSDHPLGLVYLATFHVLRVGILLKGYLWAGQEDLRVVVGLEVLLSRTVR